MSNFIPTLFKIGESLPIFATAAGGFVKANRIECALHTIVLGSAAWAIYTNCSHRQGKTEIANILPTNIISTIISYSSPSEASGIASCLTEANHTEKVLQDGLLEQQRSSRNFPMRHAQALALVRAINGPLPAILQLNLTSQVYNRQLEILRNCPNLQLLDCTSLPLVDGDIQDIIAPKLQSLSLNGCYMIHAPDLRHLINLRSLDLRRVQSVDMDKLPPSLEHLCYTIREQDTKAEPRRLTKLKSLHLTNDGSAIDSKVVWNALIQIPALQYIDLSECGATLSSHSLNLLAHEFPTSRSIYSASGELFSNRPISKIDRTSMTQKELRAIHPGLATKFLPTLVELNGEESG